MNEDADMDDHIQLLAEKALRYSGQERRQFLRQACASKKQYDAVRERIHELQSSDENTEPVADANAPTVSYGNESDPDGSKDTDESSAAPTEPFPGQEWPTVPYDKGSEADSDGGASSSAPPAEPMTESEMLRGPYHEDPDGETSGEDDESSEEFEMEASPDRTLTQDAAPSKADPAETQEDAPPGEPVSSSRLEDRPERVGPWRLIRILGRGGMGAVYLAERADGQFDQKAALKLIRHDLGIEAQRRFLSERQILAQLQHPHIAHLLDGGVTEDGRPYFAMEYVDGTPLDTYCNRNGLDVEDRLELFKQVCDAVQFAHSKLIVHRDLKPSNILVTEPNSETDSAMSTDTGSSTFKTGSGPRIKLLDFGIAKALEGAEAGKSYTRTGEGGPMTPSYAAPEQVQGDPVTTATDVYAIGLVLCELLTGVLPYDVRGRAVADAAQVIADADPKRPSQLVEENPVTDVVSAYGESPDALHEWLRGDLDVIIQKALRKEPDRRYASANNLGQDIDRYLNDLPVEARPATTGYRLRRFVTRNRTAVLSATGAVFALIIGLGVALWQGRVAAIERDRAQDNAERAEAVQTFLVDMIGRAAPATTGGDALTVREVLDETEAKLGSPALQNQPEVTVDVRRTVSKMYRLLEQAEPAVEQGRQAYDTGMESLGPEHPLTLKAAGTYGMALRLSGQVERADSLYAAVLPRVERVDADPAIRASLLRRYGTVLQDLSRTDTAEATLHRALDWHQRSRQPDTIEIARTLINLGRTHLYQKRFDDSEEQYQRALVLIEERTSDDRDVMLRKTLKNSLAILHRHKGDYGQAEEMYRQALEVSKQLYGESSADVAMILNNLSGVLEASGKLEEADELSARSLALHREHYSPSNYRIGYTLRTRIKVLRGLDRVEEAVALAEEALDIFEGSLGTDHLHTIGTRDVLKDLYWKRGELEEAVRYGKEALAGYRARYDSTESRVTSILSDLGAIRTEQGRYEEAETLLLEARAAQEEDSAVAKTRERLGALYEQWPQGEEADR